MEITVLIEQPLEYVKTLEADCRMSEIAQLTTLSKDMVFRTQPKMIKFSKFPADHVYKFIYTLTMVEHLIENARTTL